MSLYIALIVCVIVAFYFFSHYGVAIVMLVAFLAALNSCGVFEPDERKQIKTAAIDMERARVTVSDFENVKAGLAMTVSNASRVRVHDLSVKCHYTTKGDSGVKSGYTDRHIYPIKPGTSERIVVTTPTMGAWYEKITAINCTPDFVMDEADMMRVGLMMWRNNDDRALIDTEISISGEWSGRIRHPSYHVEGTITNNSDYPIKWFRITCIFGAKLSVNTKYINNTVEAYVPPQSTKPFSAKVWDTQDGNTIYPTPSCRLRSVTTDS
jgi:hypothetical protein